MKPLYLLSIFFILLPYSIFCSDYKKTEIENQRRFQIPDPSLCNSQVCPSNNGLCIFNNTCFCYPGYITILNSNTTVQCNYKQKSQIIFFLLEFVLSFGIGHIYAERYIFGCIKMVLIVILFLTFCCLVVKKKEEDKDYQKAQVKIAKIRLFLMFLFTIWQIVDAILIGEKIYKDGNGIELSEWF